MYFPVSGVEVAPCWPVASAFAVSLCCSTAGISGAFLLLPYQLSVLGYAQPGVSATNQIFNILACPAGVWRYAREGRLLLPLAMFIAAGTLPGVFIGAILRLTVLASVRKFMIFVALVLLYCGLRILFSRHSSPRSLASPFTACWRYPWAAPDWRLGLLPGAGGVAGMYCGAALQKYLPANALRILLVILILYIAIYYLIKAMNF